MYKRILVLFCFIGAAVGNVVSSGNKTMCQEHRERELNTTVVAKLVPQCDVNGDYVALACYDGDGGVKFCSCFTKKGEIAKSPSQN
ncbi:putative neurotoxin LTDF S-18-like protein, partial [Leptotrombidium deliense]